MNKNSNLYIVIYSTIMVVVVATLLAVTALSLKSRQQANMLGEKKGAILSSLEAGSENYDTYIKAYAVDAEGNILESVSADDALQMLFDLKGSFEKGMYPVFESQAGCVVLPLWGSGLWGPIWGYIALEQDMNTVKGIVLDHQGETPGLGAEIATAKHQALYKGKQIFNQNELVAITLKKGGATADNIAHEVDAITGGTKTSDGVSAMLYDSLKNYLKFLQSRMAAAQAPVEQSLNSETEVSNELNEAQHE